MDQIAERVGRAAGAAGRSLRLAWPVLLLFLVQRLLTCAVLLAEGGSLELLTSRWDAGWYHRLVDGGYVYPVLAADGSPRASNLAYFPLFPWLVHAALAVGPLTTGQALVAVSWLGGLLAVWGVFAVGHALYGRATGLALAALWSTAPASLTLTMGYPEGWFTAAAAGTLLGLIRRRPVWAGACTAVAGLLRPSAVALVAAVGAYLVVELVRWVRRRRAPATAEAVPPSRDDPAPGRALLGAVLSVTGLGGFMVYVGLRTGEVLGYFTVQGQWGQRSAGFGSYVYAVEQGLLGSTPGTLLPVTLVVALGYLLLACLVVPDRRLVWGSVYAVGILVISLSHVTFQHVYARQLLPAFVLLLPLARLRVPRSGAVAAVVLASVVTSWAGALFLLTPGAGL